MKKLLLLSLVSFTHFTHPVSAKQVIGGLACTAGAGSFAYCLYKQTVIDKQIKEIKTKLSNPKLSANDRARYTEELRSLIAHANKNELIALGSLAACGAGYSMLTPSRPAPLVNPAHIEDAVRNLINPGTNTALTDVTCPICMNSCSETNQSFKKFWTVFGECNHALCRTCKNQMRTQKKPCHLCRGPISN